MLKQFYPAALSLIASFIFLVFSTADAKIVKVNHSDLLAKLTPVPSSSQEAFSKCVKEKEDNLKVNSAIKNVSDKLETFANSRNRTTSARPCERPLTGNFSGDRDRLLMAGSSPSPSTVLWPVTEVQQPMGA